MTAPAVVHAWSVQEGTLLSEHEGQHLEGWTRRTVATPRWYGHCTCGWSGPPRADDTYLVAGFVCPRKPGMRSGKDIAAAAALHHVREALA